VIKIICAFHKENTSLKHVYDPEKGVKLLSDFQLRLREKANFIDNAPKRLVIFEN